MKTRMQRAEWRRPCHSVLPARPQPVGLATILFLLLSHGLTAAGAAETDWPMWRYDASRRAAAPAPLPEKLRLQWVRQLPTPAPAWSQEQYKLQFDRSYEPVVMGDQIFVPSMVRDSVTAYDTETGQRNWRFFCDGPVRFAPIAWQGRVYCVSDDGFLYCLDAEDGTLKWKVRLAPADRTVLGNRRLISAWPARGGPVLHEGTIYCTAGIWPFMGVFIYAIDAETGRIVWENSGTGAIYIKQQHSSPAFGGMAPQGYLTVDQDRLLVTGRTTPACFDTKTGKLLYYPLSDRSFGKYVGGCSASIWSDWYFNNDVVYRLSDGLGLGTISAQVMTRDSVVGIRDEGRVVAYQLAEVQKKDPKAKKIRIQVAARSVWESKTDPALDRIHFQAGPQFYGSNSEGLVACLAPPTEETPTARITWQAEVKGEVWRMLAGDGKLFVVTQEGQLYCFGPQRTRVVRHREPPGADEPTAVEDSEKAKAILAQTSGRKSYGLWLGANDTNLLREVLRQSEMRLVALDPNAARVASWRSELDRAGLYGSRVAVHRGNLASAELPPYWISTIVIENLTRTGLGRDASSIEKLYNLLRPYTGVAWINANRRQQLKLYQQLANADLPGCQIESLDRALIIRRTGGVPGAADWTHQYGDVANTVCSDDQLRAPLGLLWFGEESAFGDVLPRHGHGPPEQVVGGRLFIEGIDSLSARDVYTGQTLWQRKLKGLGTFGVYYDTSYKHDFRDLTYNQQHIPGANTRGTNFVATADRVYVVQGAECHVLDAATGLTQRIFLLPGQDGPSQEDWGYIGIYDKYLIAGQGFAEYSWAIDKNDKTGRKWASSFDRLASKRLVVMDRYTGKVLWTCDAHHSFIHNGIVAGRGKVFCLDAPPPYLRRKARDQDLRIDARARLIALDIRTGQVAWKNEEGAFGSWLGFSERFDILLQAHRGSRDMLWEPDSRMATFHGETGALLWDRPNKYTGPCMLRDGVIITQERAYSLITGRPHTRHHPLTDEPVPWQYSRNYGCGTAIASRNLLTFRSAAAGYFDLTCDSGTGNFGGFRSGCSSNLVVANGVLNAPDYTRTCTCSYQNQTSLAMIHMPDVEMWTFSDIASSDAPLQRVGINFGAPGDRKADNGTLWLEYPRVGGDSPEVDLDLTPSNPTWFRKHSLRLQDGNLKWVEASGAIGLRSIRVRVAGQTEEDAEQTSPTEERSFTVRLHFYEPQNKAPGQRRFAVAIGGRVVLEDFDVAAEAKSAHIGIMRQFRGIRASEFITVDLTAADASAETVISGIEIFAEDD